ncbi:MAG: hypothetical protein O7H40_08655, partial [Gammaproteobacteria bacterium]|nr:hypothetical protein [Gammaproteobacteria bacterium]
ITSTSSKSPISGTRISRVFAGPASLAGGADGMSGAGVRSGDGGSASGTGAAAVSAAPVVFRIRMSAPSDTWSPTETRI